MERCSTSLVVRELHIETTIRYPQTPTKKWLKLKILTISNVDEGVEKSEPSCIVVGNVKWYSSLEKRQFLIRINYKRFTNNPTIPILGIYHPPRPEMKIYVPTMTCSIKVFVTALIATVVHPCNGILVNNKEERVGVLGSGTKVLRS